MEVGREADKGMPRARYCMCAFQFDLTPLISLLGRRSTAQGNGRGYYIAAAARWNKVRLRPRAHIFESDLTPLPPISALIGCRNTGVRSRGKQRYVLARAIVRVLFDL